MKITKLVTILMLSTSLISVSIANAVDVDSMQMPESSPLKPVSLSNENDSAIVEIGIFNANQYKIPAAETSGPIFLNQGQVSNFEANSKKNLTALSSPCLFVLMSMPHNSRQTASC